MKSWKENESEIGGAGFPEKTVVHVIDFDVAAVDRSEA
jgi:hypothetical protein